MSEAAMARVCQVPGFLAVAVALVVPGPVAAQRPSYPSTPVGEVVDDYSGLKVSDPYRWLEVVDSTPVTEWVAAQNAVSFRYLSGLPARDSIRGRITELWDFDRVGVPFREAGRLWFTRNTGLQKQSVLYSEGPGDAEPQLVLDPNAMFPDGSVAVGRYAPSPDGRCLAYTTAEGGSDLADIHLRELATGRDLEETVPHVKFTGISWTLDGRGFFYSRFRGSERGANLTAANTNHQLWYHVLGGRQADRLIYERPDHPDWGVGGRVSEDGRYLFITAGASTSKNALFVADLGSPRRPRLDAPVRAMVPMEDAQYTPLGAVGRNVYIWTTWQAPKGRIVAAGAGDTSRARWRPIVPESGEVLNQATLAGGTLVAGYLVDVQSRLRRYDLGGKPLGDVELPDPGSIGGLSARADTPELFFAFSTYLRPTTVYRYDLALGSTLPYRTVETPFDASRYQTTQVFYSSRDGTRVPMFITARRDLPRDGRNPTMLYGYGGFDISITPGFSPAVAAWLERGGVYAVANLRGGGEYGEAWHDAGRREKKQAVFDDFIAAAEYLVREGYTRPERLAIRGGSNGGLLVGAVMTQRPDLFGVALPAVGVMDMLRFQRFTGGQFWVDEYGSSDDSTAARYLRAYSPLHNLKPGTCYPATLVTTADHDDRVVPGHSFKFAAALQAAQGCDRPALIRIETRGSHGYRPTDRVIAELADIWAFALANLEGSERTAAP
jgi:prolyl oligopeptidase